MSETTVTDRSETAEPPAEPPAEPTAIDPEELNQFVFRFVGDLGATVAAGNVVIGDRLGLYRALAGGPQRPEQLAERTHTAIAYVAEWLRGQAAGGYVSCDVDQQTYFLTPEQAFALTNPDGPVFLPGGFQCALGALQVVPRLVEAFRSGEGVGWHEQHEDVVVGAERFFRPGYAANLVPSWLPALDGVEARLRDGLEVADVGCGVGASTILMALAYPGSSFVGYDYHDESVRLARRRAAHAGVGDRVRFEVAPAAEFGGGPYDLVTTFDCLHDLGDPVGAARHVREQLRPDGTWMVVEPHAGDQLTDNLNPVGRVFYSFSTLLCVPNALSQGSSQPLGAQAGERAIRTLVTEAGFRRFRRVAETPFNLVYEVRP